MIIYINAKLTIIKNYKNNDKNNTKAIILCLQKKQISLKTTFIVKATTFNEDYLMKIFRS